MNKELINKYLNELQNPSLQWDEKAQCINPAELQRYTKLIDMLRVNCVQAIKECDLQMQHFYLNELVSKRNEILMRGFASLDSRNLLDYIMSEDNTGGSVLMSYQQLDKKLLQSVDNTISAVEAILRDYTPKEESVTKANTELLTTPVTPISDWMDVDEVCKRYHLVKNNVKNRQWRLQNNFPTHQDGGAYSKVTFHSKEVEEWLNSHKC